MVELSAAKVLRIYKRSKQELVEALEPLLSQDLAKALAMATCPEGMEVLESELLPPGVLGDLAILDLIEWESKTRPPKPSPAERYVVALAALRCAAARGIPVSTDELERMAEESEIDKIEI